MYENKCTCCGAVWRSISLRNNLRCRPNTIVTGKFNSARRNASSRVKPDVFRAIARRAPLTSLSSIALATSGCNELDAFTPVSAVSQPFGPVYGADSKSSPANKAPGSIGGSADGSLLAISLSISAIFCSRASKVARFLVPAFGLLPFLPCSFTISKRASSR